MKVLGFDAWTKGAGHYQRLVKALRDKGFELTLIHLGSWGDEKGRPSVELLQNLPAKDISYYPRGRLRDVLEQEKPSAVIFLSTDSFANRAFNRYCRQLKIPTMHVFHGLQRTLDVDGKAPFSCKAYKRLWLLRNQIVKGVLHFWPAYFRSLVETGATADEWLRFFQDLLWRTRGMRPRMASKDAKTDRACVFIDSEIDYVVNVYGYARENVFAVGNPDLISFSMPASMAGLHLRRPYANNANIMYLDTALTNYGFIYDSEHEFVHHIISTRDELARQGKHLLFRPHPSHEGSCILSDLERAGVEVCSKEQFLAKLEKCCACIVEPTSLSLLPALTGMPLLLAQYGKLYGQQFGELLRCYPRARPLRDLRDTSSILSEEQATLDQEMTMKWVETNTGPLPAERMPERVADVMISLLQKKQANACSSLQN